jgi:hypothetical protein
MKKLFVVVFLASCGGEYQVAKETCTDAQPLACYNSGSLTGKCCEAGFPYYCQDDGWCHKDTGGCYVFDACF